MTRITREVELLSQMNHENVVRYIQQISSYSFDNLILILNFVEHEVVVDSVKIWILCPVFHN